MAEYKLKHTGAEVDSAIDKVDSNWSTLMANLGIGRWENASFTDWKGTVSDVDPLCQYYTNHRRCFYHRIWRDQFGGGAKSNITINGCDMFIGDSNHSYEYCYANYNEGKNITLMLGNMSGKMSFCFEGSPAYVKIDIQEGKEVRNIGYAQGLFVGCTNLEYIGPINLKDSVQIDGGNAYMFENCSKLKTIKIIHWKGSFDIHYSTAFEESDLVEIISNLDEVTTTQTLTMGATNLAKLTDAEKQVATDKGWVLA